MPALKTLEVVARPSKKEGSSSFWSTSFMMFASDEESGAHRTMISGHDLSEFGKNMIEWAHSLPAPDAIDGCEVGYSLNVHKPARWPSGFKAAFERRPLLVRREGAKVAVPA